MRTLLKSGCFVKCQLFFFCWKIVDRNAIKQIDRVHLISGPGFLILICISGDRWRISRRRRTRTDSSRFSHDDATEMRPPPLPPVGCIGQQKTQERVLVRWAASLLLVASFFSPVTWRPVGGTSSRMNETCNPFDWFALLPDLSLTLNDLLKRTKGLINFVANYAINFQLGSRLDSC